MGCGVAVRGGDRRALHHAECFESPAQFEAAGRKRLQGSLRKPSQRGGTTSGGGRGARTRSFARRLLLPRARGGWARRRRVGSGGALVALRQPPATERGLARTSPTPVFRGRPHAHTSQRLRCGPGFLERLSPPGRALSERSERLWNDIKPPTLRGFSAVFLKLSSNSRQIRVYLRIPIIAK